MNLTIWPSFLSFLQSWKQTMNEISTSFALFFLFATLMIASNSRKMKTIVIFFLLFGLWFEKSWFWSTWSKLSKSQLHLRSTFWIWFLLFRLRIVKNDESGNRFEICIFATIGENRERMKMWFLSFVKLDETPSRLDWLNVWNWLQSNKQREFNKTKQTTISTTTELDLLLLLSASERNAVFLENWTTRFPWIFRHSSNDFLESRSI